MKKCFSFLLTLLVLLAVPVSAFAGDDVFTPAQKAYYKNLGLQGTTVNVYNWGEYISEGQEDAMNTVKEFERLTGAKVNYTNFESNENMYSKLSGGGVSYDVIIPSDYMIQRLLEEDMLLPLDYSNIPNYDKYIAPDCKGLYFDPQQKYTVCYNIGTTVLIYNKKLVKEAPKSWSVLWDEQYRDKVLMFNNSRDAFALAQFMLGQDLNTTSEEDWNAAAELLAKQKDAVHPVYVMDEVFNLMESGEYAFATYYAGDYILMQDNNPDLGCCFPEEGVNLFYDAMCVPKCTQNKKGAEAFINFMQEPQVALANQEYIYYASPNLAGGREYLVQLANSVPSTANVASYAKIVKEQFYLRTLIQTAREIMDDAASGEGDASSILDAAEQKIYDIRQGKDTGGPTKVSEVIVNGVYDRLGKLTGEDKEKYKGIPTGFGLLDTYITGLNKSAFILIGARPAMGKTSFALNLASNVSMMARKKCVFFSLEMTKEQLAERLLASQAGVPSHKLRTGELDNDEWVRLGNAAGQFNDVELYLDDTSSITVPEIKSRVRRMKDVDVIMIDYLGLIKSATRKENRVQEVSEITRQLKMLAKDLMIPVICCAQLARSTEGRGKSHKPQLSDLRESGSIEQDADIVMFLYREDYYRSEVDEDKQDDIDENHTELIVAKNRHGATGSIEMTFDKEFTRFRAVDKTANAF